MRTTTVSVGSGFGRVGEEVVPFVREWGPVMCTVLLTDVKFLKSNYT